MFFGRSKDLWWVDNYQGVTMDVRRGVGECVWETIQINLNYF